VRLRIALANDYLVPLAHVLYQIGPGNVWRFNAPLGLTRLADNPNPADLLFTGGEITLPEIAEAYSAFASLGKQAGQRSSSSSSYQPKSVLTVQDLAGRMILDDRISQSQAVLSPQLAYLVHNILADETARWPSQGYPNALEIGRPVGGKMGQVAGNQQVWTVGYTGARLAVTWLGLPAGTPANIELNPKMSAGIWHAVIQYASRDQPAQNWELPPGITSLFVCDPSGLLATRDCPTQVNELFISGSEPTSPDSLFQVFQVNRETGLLATAFTPLEMIDERTYLVFPAEFQQYAEAMGIAQPPRNYDSILPPPPVPGAQITNPKMFAYLGSVVKLMGDAAGDNFYSYHIQFGQGLNPRSWSQIAPETTQPVQNGILASWDTSRLEDGLYAVRLVVVRKDQLIDTATLQVTVDNTPPLVSVTYPVPGQTFDQQSQRQITLQAEIQETVGLQKVAWYIDGGLVGQSFQPPFSLPWTAAAGEHSLIVKAVDLAGNPGESSPLRFTVK
jgi:membrane carboxypeptidase/penicillin-binding protein PbpC